MYIKLINTYPARKIFKRLHHIKSVEVYSTCSHSIITSDFHLIKDLHPLEKCKKRLFKVFKTTDIAYIKDHMVQALYNIWQVITL